MIPINTNKAPSQGLFRFAVFHQQVLDVGLTLDPGLHHLVKRPFRLYLVHEHRARVSRFGGVCF